MGVFAPVSSVLVLVVLGMYILLLAPFQAVPVTSLNSSLHETVEGFLYSFKCLFAFFLQAAASTQLSLHLWLEW